MTISKTPINPEDEDFALPAELEDQEPDTDIAPDQVDYPDEDV